MTNVIIEALELHYSISGWNDTALPLLNVQRKLEVDMDNVINHLVKIGKVRLEFVL